MIERTKRHNGQDCNSEVPTDNLASIFRHLSSSG